MTAASWEKPPAGPASTVAAVIPVSETARLRLDPPRVDDFATCAGTATSERSGMMGQFQGCARGAARTFAFDRLGWEVVVSCADPGIARSIRRPERLGARLDPAPHDGCRVHRHLRPEGRA